MFAVRREEKIYGRSKSKGKRVSRQRAPAGCKRQCARSGVLAELRKRECYEKPSVKRKKKSEAARKRKYK